MTLESGTTGVSPDLSTMASGGGSANAQRSPVHNAFMGPNGIRAGWRLLIFVVFFLAFANAIGFGLTRIPAVKAWRHAQDPKVMTAPGQIFGECIAIGGLLLAVLLMSLIEKRTFSDYYLPLNQAFGKRFWQGVPYGFAMLSLLLALIAAFRGFSLGTLALSGADALKYALLLE